MKMVQPSYLLFLIALGFSVKTTFSGNENTAAENFSCVVYNVSIVNCSWTPGREAPKDTQYSLVFRQKDFLQETQVNIPCENERMDSHGRQIGCVSYSPNIDFGKSMNILLEGKSNVTSIGFYENILKLINYVILDPPRNITLNYTSNKLVITWERPKTHNDCKDKCFEYSINKNGEITDVIRGNSYETQNLILDQKITVSMRARYREHYLDRDRKPEWSRWSEPVTFDPSRKSPQISPHFILIVLAIVTGVILFIFIFLCHRLRIWKKLFPKVPEPKGNFFDKAEQKEMLEHNNSKLESLLKEDYEECICSPVTEISQKDQLEIMA